MLSNEVKAKRAEIINAKQLAESNLKKIRKKVVTGDEVFSKQRIIEFYKKKIDNYSSELRKYGL